MTRKEEIIKSVFEYIKSDAVKEGEEYTSFGDYINGAEWADTHPKPITYEAIENVAKEVIDTDWQKLQDRLWNMIERNLRALFIRKACKWLKDYAHMYVSETTGDINEDELINAFHKAMGEIEI